MNSRIEDRRPWVIVLGVAAIAVACIIPSCDKDDGVHLVEETVMKIELLGFSGCPNTPIMRSNLRAALDGQRDGPPLTFAEVDLKSLQESDPRRGWPAPTILVDGTDLFGMLPPRTAAMGCRMYPNGVPSVGEITLAMATCGQDFTGNRTP